MPVSVDGDVPEQRIIEQSVRVPAGGAVTGWAACRMHRANFFDGLEVDGRTRIPVPLAVGGRGNVRVDDAVLLSRERLALDEIVVIEGIPCTREHRALFDAMRRTDDLWDAVVAMDMMAAASLVSRRRMWGYVAARDGWRRVGLVRAALELASERSKSPQETRMRLIWQLLAGFPRPLVNRPVWSLSGKLLGIADLLDPVAGVVGEFDGADHRGARRHSADVDREFGFRDHGLEVFRVTGPDIAHRGRVVRRMASARARATWLPEGDRLWTIVPPPGWEREQTLDEYLDERDLQRATYARWEQEQPTSVAELARM